MRPTGSACFAAFLVIVGATSCAAAVRYTPSQPLSSSFDAKGADLTVLTYNAGLAPGIERYVSARTPLVADAVASRHADVMCLQEVWTEPEIAVVRKRLGLPPDRFFHYDTRGENEHGDRCAYDDMQGIAQCAARECKGVSDEDLTICAMQNCKRYGIWLYLFHRSCLNCLVSSVGHGLPDIERRCTGAHGSSRVYDGDNGVILASKWPLRNREVIHLPGSGANRVALLATIDVPGKGPVEFACTHLSSDAPTGPTNPMFSSWDQERRTQFLVISQRLRQRAHGRRPQVFVGDMNFGPALGGSVSEADGKVWSLSQQEGFTDPVSRVVPPLCSTCASDLQRGSKSSYLIDHVFLRQGRHARRIEAIGVRQLFQDHVRLMSYGKQVVTDRSDHYGMEAWLRLGPPVPK